MSNCKKENEELKKFNASLLGNIKDLCEELAKRKQWQELSEAPADYKSLYKYTLERNKEIEELRETIYKLEHSMGD